MADTVSPMITDAVASAQPSVADAPAIALANLYQANAQTLAIAAQNAVSYQQEANHVLQAATAKAVATLISQ